MRNWWLLGAFVLALGCGDNSRSCGPGTAVVDGTCVPTAECGFGTIADEETGDCIPDGSVVCTNGTRFDPLTSTCQVDPAACQNGTVLVDGVCADPAASTVADVQEGPEPNGLGVIEASPAQAGNITVKASGAFVLHGTIAPHRDADMNGDLDPDVDTYVLTVTAPTLLEISADGVNGLAAGFAAVPASATGPLAGWRRFGIDLGSDASMRQIYLPAAGMYRLAIADARSLFDYATGASSFPPGSDGEYYVSIKQVAIPAPTTVAIPSTTIGALPGDEVAFYAASSGATQTIRLAMPSAFAMAALVATTPTGGLVLDDEDTAAAQVTVPAGMHLIVVDEVFALTAGLVAFTLTIQ